MMLLLDIGNTRVKWGMLKDEGLLVSSKTVSLEDMHLGLGELFGDIEVPTEVLISNVAGDTAGRAIEGRIKKSWDLTPRFIAAESEVCGVRNAYPKPEQLGVDRWLAMLSVYEQKTNLGDSLPFCIVDCGSAVTFDALTPDGEHLGGLIIPGLSMMEKALNEKIHIQADVRRKSKLSPLTKDSQDAVSNGTLYALVAAIDRIIEDMEKELATSVTRIITGGDAENLLPLLFGEYSFRPNLVLEGLAVIAKGAEVVR